MFLTVLLADPDRSSAADGAPAGRSFVAMAAAGVDAKLATGRISCLIVATEIARIASDQKPAFSVARTLLEADPTAHRLVHDWRILRSHNSCQFSAEAENFRPDAVGEQSHSIGTVRGPMPMGAYIILIKQVNPDSQFFGRVPIILRRDNNATK